MLFLNLGDVRRASLIPRDPKSFTTNGQDVAEASMGAAAATILHGPESKTWSPGHPHGEMPPLENVRAFFISSAPYGGVLIGWTCTVDCKVR